MPRIHPDELTLQTLVDSLRLAGLDRALAHLTSCPDCQTRARALAGTEPSRPAARVIPWPGRADYAPVLGRGSHDLLLRAAAFEHERADAALRWREMAQLAPGEIEAALRTDARCRSWGFVEMLLEGSRERNARDPDESERLAELAYALATRLDADFYGSARLADLAARCLGQIADARHARRDLIGAERSLQDAEGLLRSGTRDPLERAELWRLRAALHRGQGRVAEAEHLLQRSLDIFRPAGEAHRAGRCLVSLAELARLTGDGKRAIERLHEALPMLDPSLEPELALIARHNLISFLAEVGLYLAGRRLLAESRAIYLRFPAPFVQWRRAWVEGRIAGGLGQLATAERAFRIAREGLGREGLDRDAAQVSLELANVLLRQQRGREAGEIAEAADLLLRQLAGTAQPPVPSPELPFPGPGRGLFGGTA